MKDIAITENHLYNKAFKNGDKYIGSLVTIHVLPDYTAKKRMLAHPKKLYTNRIGLSVTKKLGGAVERNRAKRVIRAGLRAVRDEECLKTGKLIVISARSSILGKTSEDVRRDLLRGFTRLDMLESKKAES